MFTWHFRKLRPHNIIIQEFLEEWYDRCAEQCHLFDNITELNKYVVSCTECRHFTGGCQAGETKGPHLLDMLKHAHEYDGLA